MNKKELTNLYKVLYKIRFTEEQISKEYHKGEMRCPVHLSTGQEAISGAISLLMKKKDFAISSHRAHAHYISKGGSLKRMLAEIYGKESGCSSGKGGSMHLIDLSVNFMGSTAILANSIPIGVGLALSSVLKKNKQFCFIFFGDGAVEEGAFYESINFAIIKKLPVIFICENNFYSVYTPIKNRQPKNRKIFKMVKGMSVKSFFQNSNDPLVIYNFLKEKINFKDVNSGPYFFEFRNYRWREHCGPNYDDDLNYRDKNELKKWLKQDPVKILENKLSRLDKKIVKQIKNEIEKEVHNAFKFARLSKFPNKRDSLKGVYAK